MASGTHPLHILHVTAPAPVGGLESVVLALVAGFRDRGFRVTVLAATEGDGTHPFAIAVRERNAEVVSPPRGYLAEARCIRDFASRHGVHIVHSHGYRSDILTGLLKARSRYRIASTVHGFTAGDLKSRFYERIQLRALRRFDAAIAVSDPLLCLLRRHGIPEGRLHLIPNACRPATTPLSRALAREKLGLPAHGLVIGWVGRLSPEKAPELALQALGQLDLPDWTAVMVGDGPPSERASLRALAEQLGIAPRVRWPGLVPKAGELFTAFDVLLQSSRTEGTPVVLLEAMAAGVPIVAASVGGVPDLLAGGTAGWLAPRGSSAALSHALREALAGGPTVTRRVAAARRRLAADYDPEQWLTRYENVYRDLLAGSPQ